MHQTVWQVGRQVGSGPSWYPLSLRLKRLRASTPRHSFKTMADYGLHTGTVARGLPFTPSFYQAFIESVRLGSPMFQVCTQAKNHPTFILSMGSKMSQVYGFIIFVEEQWYIITQRDWRLLSLQQKIQSSLPEILCTSS